MVSELKKSRPSKAGKRKSKGKSKENQVAVMVPAVVLNGFFFDAQTSRGELTSFDFHRCNAFVQKSSRVTLAYVRLIACFSCRSIPLRVREVCFVPSAEATSSCRLNALNPLKSHLFSLRDLHPAWISVLVIWCEPTDMLPDSQQPRTPPLELDNRPPMKFSMV